MAENEILLHWNVDDHEFLGVTIPGEGFIAWKAIEKWHALPKNKDEYEKILKDVGYKGKKSYDIVVHYKNPICGVEVDGKIVYCKH